MDNDTTSNQLGQVLDDLADVLDQIGAEQASASTPCSEYDVATLRQHVIGWLTAFTDGFSDASGLCSDQAAVAVSGTGADQVRQLRSRLDGVLPAAADRPLRIGETAMPGAMALSMILWEYQMHGWDLARATDQAWSPGTSGLETSLTFAPNMLTDDYQGEGKIFAPRVPVPDDAAPLDRLLGLSGRDPKWTAGS